MKSVFGIAKKDLLLFFREKESIFWMLIFPIVMMLFFSSIFGGGGSAISFELACVDLDHGEIAKAFIEALNSTNITSLKGFEDVDTATSYVASKSSFNGLLVIPEDFTYNLTSGYTANVKFYVKVSDPSVEQTLTSFLEGFVEKFNEGYRSMMLQYIVQSLPENMSVGGMRITREEFTEWMQVFSKPVNISYGQIQKSGNRTESVAYWENKGHWVVVMFAYTFLFSGMVASTSILVEEKTRKTLKRIRLSPTSVWNILTGKILASLLMLSISQILLVALTLLILKPRINWSPELLPLVIIGDLASLSLGLILAEVSPSQKAAGQAAVAIGVLLQFFTGMYIPVQFLPGTMRKAAELLPFTKAVEALDGILISGLPLVQVAKATIYLAASALIFLMVAVALFPRWASKD